MSAPGSYRIYGAEVRTALEDGVIDASERTELALEHYQQALRVREQIGERKLIAGTLSNIAGIHRQRGEEATAIAEHRRKATQPKFARRVGLDRHEGVGERPYATI